ncbi:MAG: hydrogenase nickel incorporation protein HypA [Crenarchaeota archaeon]|nr:hydrogenase nickel incorporation protein HypA [Thermoproteota archaeon]
MHEWALAEAIARYAESVCSSRRVSKIVVKLGTLQAIDREVLSFALNAILESDGIRGAEIVLEDEEAVFRCRRCGATWRYSDVELDEALREAIHFLPEAVHSFVRCPRCGSRDFEVVKGRGVEVAEVVCGDGSEGGSH